MPGTIETLNELHDALALFGASFDPDHCDFAGLKFFGEICHRCGLVIRPLQQRGIDVAALIELKSGATLPRIKAADDVVVCAMAALADIAPKLAIDGAKPADSLTDKQEQALRYIFEHRNERITANDVATEIGINVKTLNKPTWVNVRAQLKVQKKLQSDLLQMKTGPGSKTKGQLEAVAQTTKR